MNQWLVKISTLVVLATIPVVGRETESPGRDLKADRTKVGKKAKGRGVKRIQKPKINDTVRANIYADNWFKLYINGSLVAVDSISFIPHNVVSVDVLPEYPMTIAVMAKDNADSKTGLEYNHTNLGDGGFILKFGDGTVTNGEWKAKNFFHGPLNRDLENPKTKHEPLPVDWFTSEFDDSEWEHATEHPQDAVGPKETFFQHDFDGARWIWTQDLALDNLVLFRHTVDSPPDGTPLPPDWPRGMIDASNHQSQNR
ncbi:MAG: hypothetical protein AAGJ79_09335 [Verrucomicrobiota bacterium]